MTHTPGTPPPLRLFTALWPPPAVRDALLVLRDRWQWPPGARLADASKLHITLHFIGSVEASRLPALVDGLAVPMERTELRIDTRRQRVWPGGIAVVELQMPEMLQRMHALLAHALSRLGLGVEARPWRPHVTFARKAAGAVPPAAADGMPSWPVDGYALVRSAGGRYDILQRYAAAKVEP
ncbi:RNA 2',3'-cyclic phosphodiesterase [Ramlibacter sp. MMS24-I3-19]|uniref:RNA 2',3'-cyclic phosphodiesterase n=1 Tax=Ramlibacter sp. MMS24-I3-19 TaxID=3416606 RepID=UPI003D092BCE